MSSGAPSLDEVELETRHVGHFPVLRALIGQLRIDTAIEEALPKDPRNRVSDAQCIVAMVLNVLSGRCALYSMGEFFEHVDTEVVLGADCPPDALNDARLAAALDHVFDFGVDSLMGRIVGAYLGREGAPDAYSAYLDTTSISLHGNYDVIPATGAPAPARGFSKDHRPDLKQLIFGLSVHGAAGVPLTSAMLDGNTSDKAANLGTLDQLGQLLPKSDDVTVVGDSKLVDAQTFGRLLAEDLHFLSLVPLTYGVRSALVEEVRTAGKPLPELARSPGRRKADPAVVYRGQSFVREMKVEDAEGNRRAHPMTLLVVRSDAQETGFDNAFDKRLAKETRRFESALKKATRKRFRCRADAEAARDTAMALLKWQTVELAVQPVEVRDKRSGPGRPRKGDKPPTHTEFTLVAGTLQRDETAIAKDRFHAAHFVLVTDRTDWDDARILQEYRDQSLIEGHCGFRWLKNIASVAPILLETPHRIAALGFVFMLALMVRNYFQFELRRQLQDQNETVRGRKRRIRTKNPTTETALLNFMGLSTVLVYAGDTLLTRRGPSLSDDARTILRLLQIPHEVYTTPLEKWPSLAPKTSGM